MNHISLHLPPELMERSSKDVPAGDPRVSLVPRVGENAALIDLGYRYLAA